MSKLLQKNKDIAVIIIWLIPFISSLLLFSENIARALVLTLSLLVWLYVYFKSEKKVFSSILFLIFISAFNITLTLGDLDGCYKNNVYVNYLCPTLHIVDIFTVLTFVVTVLNIKVSDVVRYILISLPLLIYSILHVLTHPNLNTLIGTSRIFLTIMILLLSYEHVKEGLKEKSTVFKVIALSLGIQLIISFFQFILRRDLGLQLLGESTILAGTINSSFVSFSFGEYLRSYGTFPHPNVLAGFVLALLMISFRVFSIKDWRLVLISFISIVLTLLSLSRLHIVLLGFVILFYTLRYVKDRYFSFFPILFERFISLGGNSVSVRERVVLFKESLRIFKENWLLGVGNGEFVRYLDNGVRTNSNISLFQPVHNIPMLILAEHGIFGTLTYFLYFFYLILRRNRDLLITILTVFVILSIGLFDHYLFTLPQGLIVLLMILL